MELLLIFALYFVNNANLEEEEIRETIKEIFLPQIKSNVMTSYQSIKAVGKEEGIEARRSTRRSQ